MKSIQAISTFLGDKDYFFGSKISSYDLIIHSFVSNALYCDLNPKIQIEAKKLSNLDAYSNRVLKVL